MPGRGASLLLAAALLAPGPARAVEVVRISVVASVTDARSPFGLTDVFCAAPLGVLGDGLYAGGQRDGALYRVDPDATP